MPDKDYIMPETYYVPDLTIKSCPICDGRIFKLNQHLELVFDEPLFQVWLSSRSKSPVIVLKEHKPDISEKEELAILNHIKEEWPECVPSTTEKRIAVFNKKSIITNEHWHCKLVYNEEKQEIQEDTKK